MTKNELVRFAITGQKDVGYNAPAKEAYLRDAKRLARDIAKALNLAPGDFDLRVNKGGIAVSGEVTLHTDHVYIQIGQHCDGAPVLYRDCKGRKDYTGGTNRYLRWEDLTRDFADAVNSINSVMQWSILRNAA